MTKSQQHAWIFLSVGESPSPLDEVIGTADAINRAIPTHRELQESLGWLIENGLIDKAGKKYCLTEAGKAIRDANAQRTWLATWHALTEKLAAWSEQPAVYDSVTLEEAKSAHNIYRKRFWKMYRELKEKDKKGK
jgi:hypothetical protein